MKVHAFFFFMPYNKGVMKETYCTTKSFSHIGRRQECNCGPTAITNAVLTLQDRDDDPERVYQLVAETGKKRLTYWNFDLFHMFGGTVDFLTKSYLEKVFEKKGMRDIEVSKREKMTKENVINALERGSILYIQFRHHPRYGCHHVLAYEGHPGRHSYFLKLADGWSDKPRYIDVNELGRGYIIEISEKR